LDEEVFLFLQSVEKLGSFDLYSCKQTVAKMLWQKPVTHKIKKGHEPYHLEARQSDDHEHQLCFFAELDNPAGIK
jgi:hypothetical protein